LRKAKEAAVVLLSVKGLFKLGELKKLMNEEQVRSQRFFARKF
jgi:hypothetical protein